MNFRNISAWSIRNPVVPLVLFTALLLLGVMSFARMNVVNDPNVEFPFVNISISQPGAAPTEIENQITQRVEAAVRGITGVKNISSSASEGSSYTGVEFEIGVDTNVAVNEVNSAIQQIRGELPDGILEPRVSKEDTSARPIGYFAVSAPDMTAEQLSWYVDDTVAKRLLSIEGMSAVERLGGVDREIRVTLDPARMQSLGVTAAQINQVLRGTNINSGGGQAEIAGSRQSVRVLGNAPSAYALGQSLIPLPGNRTVRLNDVAAVTDGTSERTRLAEMDGRDTVIFNMSRTKEASDVTVYDEAVAAMDDITAENPGITFKALSNDVDYTKGQYHSSMAAMVEGAVLAVVVVFLFLRDWRATAISAVAIPLSAIPTFWFMDLMGFNLNQLSLLALGLVAGVLVDDAIVEIENIVRHMRMGKTAYQASIDAADEIGLAVVATTMSIVAVFLPVGLMPGISGQFFKNFGFTVVVAVLTSLAVARMITPMIAAYFLKAHGEATHGESRTKERYLGILRWTLDRRRATAFAARGGWRRSAALFLDHRMWIVGIGAFMFGLTILIGMQIPQQFEPDTNEDSARAQIEMVPGTTLDQTYAVTKRVETLLAREPEVESTRIYAREGSGSVNVTLKEDRDTTSQEFQRRVAPKLQAVPDARVSFQERRGGPGSGRAISVMLAGSDPALLNRTAAKLVQQMGGVRLVSAPRVKADLKRPELIVRPRQELAASLGVSTQALSQTIRIATLGDIDQNSAKFSLSDRQVPIRVMLPQSSRRDISTIANLPVPTASGGSVPLGRVAELSFSSGPTTIERYNQQRRVFVGADLAPGVVKGDATKAIEALPIMQNLPNGVTNKAVGEDQWQAEFVVDFAIAIVSGVLLVFAVLVLLYKRFMSPLVNMGSLLLAPLGGLIALLIVGQPFSIAVYIGMLMLIGIVGKNSILLIDFALEEMHAGVDKDEAIVDAGRKRAQPIVMTTIAMVAGMVPTALSLSGDGAWRAPMGTVVIGGLIVSTILTLLIVPASFSLADSFEKWLGPKFGRILSYRPGDELGPAADPSGDRPGAIPAHTSIPHPAE